MFRKTKRFVRIVIIAAVALSVFLFGDYIKEQKTGIKTAVKDKAYDTVGNIAEYAADEIKDAAKDLGKEAKTKLSQDSGKLKEQVKEKVNKTIDLIITDPEITKATVKNVIDGDTICVFVNGKERKVRFIGINTPESEAGVKSGYVENQEYFGKEASEYTKSILKKGDSVWLSKDQSDTDKYDRLLRIVWIKKPDKEALTDVDRLRSDTLQGILLTNGYATTMSVAPDVNYSELFSTFQSEAMEKELGMWEFLEE